MIPVGKPKGKKAAPVTEEKPWKKEASDIKPHKAINAYMYFSQEWIPKYKETEKLSHVDAMKRTGAEWKLLSEDQKGPYNLLYNKDVLRYDAQCKELKTKGYFMIGDGTKSSDLDPKIKQKVILPKAPKDVKKRSALTLGKDKAKLSLK